MAVFALAIILTACGGGGGGGGGQTPGVTTITITGTLSDVVTAPKLKPGQGAGPMSAVVWLNALVEIIDSSGNVVTTTTASGIGGFIVNVRPGPDYFIRVSIGNLALM
ncbi:MAG: hypothetical protein ACE5EN_03025 [Nitrospinota bacterium]